MEGEEGLRLPRQSVTGDLKFTQPVCWHRHAQVPGFLESQACGFRGSQWCSSKHARAQDSSLFSERPGASGTHPGEIIFPEPKFSSGSLDIMSFPELTQQ